MQTPAPSQTGPIRTLKRLAMPALLLLVALCLAYLNLAKQRKKQQKQEKRTRLEVKRCSEIVKEMEAEANFVIKVAYLKFEE